MVLKKETKKQDIENEDVVFEDDSGGTGTPKTSFKAVSEKKLKEKLDKCIAENKENLLGWQRARADFVNAKKENEIKVKETYDFAKMKFSEEMLPVLDSFDMAFINKEAWEKVDKNWRVGVEYIHSQMLTIFENNGLKQIDKAGDVFDPEKHISTETVIVDKESENGIVIEIIQKGYEFKDEVIRPAKVKVGEYKEP